MGTTDPLSLPGLVRQGARDLLEIPATATNDEVLRHCLDLLEKEEFRPERDVAAAIEVLCGTTVESASLPSDAPGLARKVERLVCRELEVVAMRLRTEPGLEVLPDLQRLADVANLFRSTTVWNRRLMGMAGKPIRPALLEQDQARLADALVELATTWPGDTGAVRRKHLVTLVPRARYAVAARRLHKQFPDLADLDPLLMSAIEGTTPPAPRKPPDSPPAASDPVVSRLLVILLVAAFVALGITKASRLAKNDRTGTLSSHPPRVPFPSQSTPLFAKPGEFQILQSVVYAPRKVPAAYALIPGETASVLGIVGDEVHLILLGMRTKVRFPKGDILHEHKAYSELQGRTQSAPDDAMAWLAYANVALTLNDQATVDRALENVRRLGLKPERKMIRGQKMWVPVDLEPTVPPPPPLPALFKDPVRKSPARAPRPKPVEVDF